MPVRCGRTGVAEGASPGEAGAGDQPWCSRDMPKPSTDAAPTLETWLDLGGGIEELGQGLWVMLPMLALGLGAESWGEFVFISIYCCWERRGGLCGGLEMLCCSSPPTLWVLDEAPSSVGLLGLGQGCGDRDGDWGWGHLRPPKRVTCLIQGAAPGLGP